MAKPFIHSLSERIQAVCDREGKPMGLSEYLNRFIDDPASQCRSAAHYIRDTFDYFGSRTIESPTGKVKRYLYDLTPAEA